jgi:acetyl-CoA C-acetyltransferase
MAAARAAGKKAFDAAGVKHKDVDVAELHDCFSINMILNLEDLGFCAKGEGGRFVEEGRASLKGELPVNTTGGLKAIGHPVGATGVRQVCDLFRQLAGRGHNQVKGAKTGLSLNIGGAGATAVCNILSSEVPE